MIAGIIVVLLALAAFGIGISRGFNTAASPTATPPTTVGPTVAPTSAPSLAAAVDGIQCGQLESLAYHIHQHLTLYQNGHQVPVPSEIGIPGGEQAATCFYWIHVHAATPNIIHVESPIKKTFPLGDFFDIWAQTKGTANPPGDAYVVALQAAERAGTVTTFVDGKRWTGSYRTVPLKEHAVITVEIGKPVVPPQPFTNWQGL